MAPAGTALAPTAGEYPGGVAGERDAEAYVTDTVTIAPITVNFNPSLLVCREHVSKYCPASE